MNDIKRQIYQLIRYYHQSGKTRQKPIADGNWRSCLDTSSNRRPVSAKEEIVN